LSSTALGARSANTVANKSAGMILIIIV